MHSEFINRACILWFLSLRQIFVSAFVGISEFVTLICNAKVKIAKARPVPSIAVNHCIAIVRYSFFHVFEGNQKRFLFERIFFFPNMSIYGFVPCVRGKPSKNVPEFSFDECEGVLYVVTFFMERCCFETMFRGSEKMSKLTNST